MPLKGVEVNKLHVILETNVSNMNRYKKIFLMGGVAILGAMGAGAQQAAGPYLDAYTIPVKKKNAVIGKIYDSNGKLGAAVLLEDKSGLFTISGNELKLKKKASVDVSEHVTYPVRIKAGEDAADFLLVADDFIRNKVIAHRGAWKHHEGSQNSLTSLKDAIKLGCEGSEFDVWLSSDDQLVISHDPEIGGKKVEESTLADLQTVQLKNGDRVPTLEEYINTIMEQQKTRLVLELKPSAKGRGSNWLRRRLLWYTPKKHRRGCSTSALTIIFVRK